MNCPYCGKPIERLVPVKNHAKVKIKTAQGFALPDYLTMNQPCGCANLGVVTSKSEYKRKEIMSEVKK